MAPNKTSKKPKGKAAAAAAVSDVSDTPDIPDIPADSSFTPESFERELKSLAAKAQNETPLRAVRTQLAIYGRALLLLVLGAASANASVAALSPVFGGIPAGLRHPALVATALFAGWSSNLHIRRLLPDRWPLVLWLPLLAAYVPVCQTLVSGPLASRLGARWGPVAVEALSLLPLLTATVACVANELERATGLDEVVPLPRWIGDALPGIGTYSVYKLAERYTAVIGVPVASGSGTGSGSLLAPVVQWLRTRVARQLAVAVAYGLAAPSKLAVYAVPALLHTLVLNTHLAHAPWALDTTNRAFVGATPQWAVVDRRESLTGYISVVDNLAEGYRVLRCDHSLLGGEWTRVAPGIVAEPIYGVFVMMEAVRLVERSGAPDAGDAGASGASGAQQTALVIGMGVGTSPAALMAHGIDTTVVEIDPVVHEFASRYFQLPASHKAVIEDAVTYTDRLVAEQAEQSERGSHAGQYDYILHDVFTGGAEPIPLFTLEFLQNLHALLKPSGVVAINYAGDFALAPIKAVVLTIRAVFPACRIFREYGPEVLDTASDFVNVVIFCTKSGTKDSDVVFRAPTEADMLRSRTRQALLMPRVEVHDSDFQSPDAVRVVRRNDTEQLSQYHAATAIGHWEVMRTVVDAKMWEMW